MTTPKKLYKYAKFCSNTISSLQESYVWYATPQTLNDPFDCDLVAREFDHGWFESHGVLSLSATNSNVIMWSHYAGCHSGLCIEYTDYTDEQLNREPIQSRLKSYVKPVPTSPLTIRNARPIEYLTTEEMNERLSKFPQSLGEVNERIRMHNTGERTNIMEELLEAIYIKHHDWSYEREYRLDWMEGARAIYSPGHVTALYLGMYATPQHCAIAVRIAESLNDRA
ncbi:MAG: DUF2971 domain-containing protein [Proteobacteria bacterium]|nr:DUF2971 domain-containing protein [Pseudomonadota bacterium]